MSSKEPEQIGEATMSIRLSEEVMEMIDILKDALDYPNKSKAVYDALVKAYPELPEIAKQVKATKSQRAAILGDFADSQQ